MKVFDILIWFFFTFLLINQSVAQGFVQNTGQLRNEKNEPNESTLYYANFGDFRVHLNRNGFSYELIRKQNNNSKEEIFDNAEILFDFNRVDIFFENQSFKGLTETENQLFSEKFYRGNDFFEAGAYQKITYKEVYPNIDVVFYANTDGFKYDFVVHPGGYVKDIVLNFKSPFDTYLLDGSVVIDAQLNKIQEFVPLSYFLNSEEQIQVDYVSMGHEGINNLFSFHTLSGVNVFDKTLVIDPMPNLWFGTYISGNLDEYPQDVTVDKQGNIYVVGFTNSINNIATNGAFQETFEAVFDAFLVKYAPDGIKLWGTYIGGNSFDRAYGVIYKDGNLYVCGNSFSSNFATPGVHQTVNMNADDAFLAKFDVSGNRIWCTYYGGELHDFAESVVIDDQNNLYITGHTSSFANIATLGAHQESFFGVSAGFLAKFTNQGQLIWGTYYGSSFQEAYGLSLDSEQNIIFSGFTTSSSGIASPGAQQTVLGGNMDAFLAKFNPAGQRLWGTYFGGPADDFGYDVCVDGTNNIYVMGNTSSAVNISLGTGFQLAPGSVDDGFVAKFNASGNLQWSTYIGGNEAEYLKAIESFYDEGVIVVGKTQSNNGIATPGALFSTLQGQYDGFLMKISTSGALEWGTFYGGSFSDEFTGVAIRSSNTYIHAVGFTLSENGIATQNAHQTQTFGGMFNGFLTQFCSPVVPVLIHDIVTAICDDNTYTIGVGPIIFDTYVWNDGSTPSFIELSDLLIGSSYEIYVNTVDTNNCAYHSDTLFFGVFEGFDLNIFNAQESYCAFDTAFVFTDEDYVSYFWSSGGTGFQEDVILNTPGINQLSVQVTDFYGCQVIETVEFVVLPSPDMPDITITGSTNFCLGETVELSVPDLYFSYLWSNQATGSSIILSEAAWISVIVFNELGCSISTDSIQIGSDVLFPQIVLLSDPPICPGTDISFGLTNDFDGYLWNTGDLSEEITLEVEPGLFFIAVEVNSICGSAGLDTFFYLVPEYFNANIEFIEPDLICLDSEIEFSLPGSLNNMMWQEDFFGSNYVATPNSSGIWQIYVQAYTSQGCVLFDTVFLEVQSCYLGNTENQEGLFIFPNPFTKEISIESAETLKQIYVYDLFGRLLHSFKSDAMHENLFLDKLASGSYILEIIFKSGRSENHLIIKSEAQH